MHARVYTQGALKLVRTLGVVHGASGTGGGGGVCSSGRGLIERLSGERGGRGGGGARGVGEMSLFERGYSGSVSLLLGSRPSMLLGKTLPPPPLATGDALAVSTVPIARNAVARESE